jgi:hypothetical protein
MERLMDGKKVKVYNNPAGGENSTSVAGFKLSEKESSYIMQKAGDKPFILRKGNYEDEFDSLFGNCPEFTEYAGKNTDLRKFKHLGTAVENYNMKCE